MFKKPYEDTNRELSLEQIENKYILNSNENFDNFDNEDEAAPPSLFNLNDENNKNAKNNNFYSEDKISTKCDCIELDKLLLTNSSFIYKSKINKNDFYKVFCSKKIEINFQKIIQNYKKYDKFIDIYHYNFTNLFDYIKKVLYMLKNLNKKKINYNLDLHFENKKKFDQYNDKENKEKKFYNFDITCKYLFKYYDKKENIDIKKKYEHKNIFDEITQITNIKNIITDIENIFDKINIKNINENEVIIKNKENKNKKINKLNKSKLNIIHFQKCVDKHEKSCQMIKELDCGNFVSCGLDGSIILFDENMNKLTNEKIINNWIYSISEIPDTKNEFMVCCPEKIILLNVIDNKLNIEKRRLNIRDTLNLYAFATSKEKIIFCGNDSVNNFNGIIKDLKENEQNNIVVVDKIEARCGKKITENIISVVSNKILLNGKDSLKFINISKSDRNSPEENYSFNIGPNSLLIIETDIDIKNNTNIKKKNNKKKKKGNIILKNNEKAKLLLCACTKYYKEQNNGILILCLNSKKIKNNFYDTGEFEVFCFCSLKTNKENNNKNYILVGGYDNDIAEGLIKLYEIIFDENDKIENTQIKFISTIHDKIKFDQPINCIIQSSKTEEIIVTSWDGSVNVFSKPNFDFIEM